MKIMSNLNKVLNFTLNEISLTKKEEKDLKARANEIIAKLRKVLTKESTLIGGSLAKGTLIKKEEQDIDIFVVFDNEESTNNLETILNKAKINAKKIHGSRDYFQLVVGNIIFEFIPIVKADSKKQNKNVTDFSPLHVRYLKRKATKKVLNEIKLAKAFCQAQNVYGAESYIQGLSGYAIELLVCHYKTFTNFLKGIQKDSFIDMEKSFKNKNEAFREINQSKLLSPLILIDPTNKHRNVCAGLNQESLDRLRDSAKKFLKSPSSDFFKVKNFNEQNFLENSKKNSFTVSIIELRTNRENKDIAGTKMKKFVNFLINELNRKEQTVVNSEFIFNRGKNAKVFIALNKKEFLEIKGPKKEMSLPLKEFKKARKTIYFSKGYAYAREKFNLINFLDSKKKVANEMGVEFVFNIYN